jgi:hypothetical protein
MYLFSGHELQLHNTFLTSQSRLVRQKSDFADTVQRSNSSLVERSAASEEVANMTVTTSSKIEGAGKHLPGEERLGSGVTEHGQDSIKGPNSSHQLEPRKWTKADANRI